MCNLHKLLQGNVLTICAAIRQRARRAVWEDGADGATCRRIRALVTGGTSGIGASIVERLPSRGRRRRVHRQGRGSRTRARSPDRRGVRRARTSATAPGGPRFRRRGGRQARRPRRARRQRGSPRTRRRCRDTTDEAWDAVLETNLRRLLPLRGRLPAPSSRGRRWLDHDDLLGRRRLGRDGDRRLLGLQAGGEHARADARRRGGPDGIRVNAVCPGDTAPGMATYVAGRDETSDPASWTLPPLARVGTGADVAGAVTFFASRRRRVLQRVDPARRRRHARGAESERGRERGTSGARHSMTVRLGLDGRRGLVSAGRRRLGRACVQRLRDEGMTIAFTSGDRRGRRRVDRSSETGGSLHRM